MSARNNRDIFALYLSEKSYVKFENFAGNFVWDDVLLCIGYFSPLLSR